PPRPGDAWRMNFYAMKNNGGAAWAPILGVGNFHRAPRFRRGGGTASPVKPRPQPAVAHPRCRRRSRVGGGQPRWGEVTAPGAGGGGGPEGGGRGGGGAGRKRGGRAGRRGREVGRGGGRGSSFGIWIRSRSRRAGRGHDPQRKKGRVKTPASAGSSPVRCASF